MDQIDGSGFQPGKAQIQGISVHLCLGHGIFGRVAGPAHPVQGRAAGIGHSQHPGNLVKAFAGSVVPGAAQDLHPRVVLHVHQHGVAAGDHQTEEGGLQVRVGDVVGRDVAPDVMHRNQRHAQGEGCCLGEVYPHQHRADQSGGIGDRHRVDVLPGQLRGLQGLIRQGIDGLNVLPGGDFRHHAAVDFVDVHLGGDTVRQNGPPVDHNGHSGLVAGGLNR